MIEKLIVASAVFFVFFVFFVILARNVTFKEESAIPRLVGTGILLSGLTCAVSLIAWVFI